MTNRHCGGTPLPINTLLTNLLGLNPGTRQDILTKLHSVAIQTAKCISRSHPKCCEFGIDVGIDLKRRPWIYQVTISPGIQFFKQADQKAYWRLVSLRKKAYE